MQSQRNQERTTTDEGS